MSYSKLFAIHKGDYMTTFGGFSCIGADVLVKIESDQTGLYFACADGKHYLKNQLTHDGFCLGLTQAL